MGKTKSGRGGKRPGAGRKPTTGRTTGVISCVLNIFTIKELDEIAKKMGESRNVVLKRAVIAFLMKKEIKR